MTCFGWFSQDALPSQVSFQQQGVAAAQSIIGSKFHKESVAFEAELAQHKKLLQQLAATVFEECFYGQLMNVHDGSLTLLETFVMDEWVCTCYGAALTSASNERSLLFNTGTSS